MDKPRSTVSLPPDPVHCFPTAHIRIVRQASCRATDTDLAGNDIDEQERAAFAEEFEFAVCELDAACCVRDGRVREADARRLFGKGRVCGPNLPNISLPDRRNRTEASLPGSISKTETFIGRGLLYNGMLRAEMQRAIPEPVNDIERLEVTVCWAFRDSIITDI